MQPFIHCRVSLEINNGQMESLNATYVKLFVVKVTQKQMGVNGMLTAGEGLLANGGPQFSFWWITPLLQTEQHKPIMHITG